MNQVEVEEVPLTPPWITVPEASLITKIPEPTIKRWARSKFISVHKSGSIWLVHRPTLELVAALKELGISIKQIVRILDVVADHSWSSFHWENYRK